MKYTKEQMIAAREAIWDICVGLNNKGQAEKLADAALTAAADLEHDIIEKCVKQIEWFRDVDEYMIDDIIDRVRALKDKP